MTKPSNYDVIIVGSGTCGATLAKALCESGKKVLVLEKGNDKPLSETLGGLANMAREVRVGDKLKAAKAEIKGGSTGMYFAIANKPPVDYFASKGIDIAADAEDIWQQLPIAPLAEDLMSPQSLLVAQYAEKMGISVKRNSMLIDQSQCQDGYNYQAKWKARRWLEQAQSLGCELVCQATVSDIIVESNQATGVRYQVKSGMFSKQQLEAKAKVVVLASGSLSTPQMLRRCGLSDIGKNGFYCDPGIPVFGLVPSLKGRPGYVGTVEGKLDGDIKIGDANMTPMMYRALMLMNFKMRHLFNYEQAVGLGVMVQDGLGGEMDLQGKLHKDISTQDKQKLAKGVEAASNILKQAGAKHIITAPVTSGGHIGGMVRLGQDVDDKLQTQIENLYVCDGSLLDENVRVTPTVTLICLARYLSRQLNAQL